MYRKLERPESAHSTEADLGRREFMKNCGRFTAAVSLTTMPMLLSMAVPSDAAAAPDKRELKGDKQDIKEEKREIKEEKREEKNSTRVPEIDAMSGGAALAVVGATTALLLHRSKH